MRSPRTFKDNQSTGSFDWPEVTVIIVTKKNHDLLLKAVESIRAVDYPQECVQVVVLEEGDVDQPINGPNVEYHRIPVRDLGVGYARNAALVHARNDIIVFTDDDCTVDRLWLKEIVRPLAGSTSVAAIAGAVKVPPCGPVGRCENILGFPGGGLKYIHKAKGEWTPVFTFSTCNCSINRALFKPLRFMEGFQASGEDELLSRSISNRYTILYNPGAIVYHRPRDSFESVFRWFIRRGQARVVMSAHTGNKAKYVAHLIYISPFFRLIGLTILCAVVGLPLIPTLAVVGLFYYVSIVWRFRWARKYDHPLSVLLLLPLVRTTMDIGLDIGTLNTLWRSRFNGANK